MLGREIVRVDYGGHSRSVVAIVFVSGYISRVYIIGALTKGGHLVSGFKCCFRVYIIGALTKGGHLVSGFKCCFRVYIIGAGSPGFGI